MSPSEKLPVCRVSQGTRRNIQGKLSEINKNIFRPGGCNNYTICLHSTHDSPDHYRPPRTEIQLSQIVEREPGRGSVHTVRSHLSRKCRDGSQPSKVSRNSILTLSIIVILYLVCNAPRLTLNTVEYYVIR